MSAQLRPDIFKYFKQLSGTAKQGLTILVIGESGSGKTTLISNLLGVEITEEGTSESINVTDLTITTSQQDILGIRVTIHETCGPESEQCSELACAQSIRTVLGTPDESQLVIIYCFKMCETRLRNSLIESFLRCNEMGIVWEKTVIALTFADALPTPRAARQDPSFSEAKFFNERLNEWKERIGALLHERIGLTYDCVQMVPTIDSVQELLPNQQPWVSPFWDCLLYTINKCDNSESLTQQPQSTAVSTKANIPAWKSQTSYCHSSRDVDDHEPLLRRGAFKCEEGLGGYASTDDTSEENTSLSDSHWTGKVTATFKTCLSSFTKCCRQCNCRKSVVAFMQFVPFLRQN